MTLSTTAARVSYAGNGATTSFAFAFKIWAASDLKVYLRDDATRADTLQTLTTHYTVDIVSYPGAGNVVFAAAPASGKTVVILRDAAVTQELDLMPSGTFAAETVETALDKIVGHVQALAEKTARAPLLPVGTSLANLALPEPTLANAGRAIGINNSGDGFADIAAAIPSASVSAFAATLLDDANAAALFATLGFVFGSATWDIPSVANNGQQAQTFTVNGIVQGDFVVGVSFSGNLLALSLRGQVSATNTLGLVVSNHTGSSQDPGSQTFYYLILKKSALGL